MDKDEQTYRGQTSRVIAMKTSRQTTDVEENVKSADQPTKTTKDTDNPYHGRY
jgi:hypothetical protein